MQTIVLATQKGGVGKSTLAIGLALAAIQAGHNVRLIETDPQGTASNWQRRRPYADADRRADLRRRARSNSACRSLARRRRDGDDRRYRRRRQRRDHGRDSPFRPLPDPGAAEHRRHRGDRRDARASSAPGSKPFAFVLNQTPIRGQRIASAANALGDEAALDARRDRSHNPSS